MNATTARLVLAAVVALSLGLPGPALANKVTPKVGPEEPGLKDFGTIQAGTMRVGKNRTFCTNDGSSDVSGPGLGLPVSNTRKNAYYAVEATVSSLANAHTGALRFCGRLDKVKSNVAGGTGAACGASKGWAGKGTIVFPAKGVTIWLHNLGWKTTAGGTAIVTGYANQAANEQEAKAKFNNQRRDWIKMGVQAAGAAACLTKNDANKAAGPGATNFTVNGDYTIKNTVTGQEGDQNLPAGMCKGAPATGCAYGPKKPGAAG